jgi:predicted ribosome quality control (RQC) complex YloA/Tae2 family protein
MKKLKEKMKGSKIQKIKQIKDSYSLELYKDQKFYLMIIPDKNLFLTDKNYGGETKDDFCNLLRKYLTGQFIEEVNQHEFDRVVEIETQDYRLIAELFGNGNLILVKKPENEIIRAINMRSWASRDIKPKKEYKYPPSGINPFKLNVEDIRFYLGQKEIVKVLAVDFGFGGEIAEKICEKIGIDKDSKEEKQAEKIYQFLKRIDGEFPEMDNLNDKIREEFEKHLKDLDLFEGDIQEKLEKIRKEQDKKMEELVEKENTYRIYGESIYDSYPTFDNKLTRLRELQDQDIPNEEIEKRLEVEFLPEGTKVLIEGVPIDYKKSLEDNANDYYNLAKKMKSKIEGLEEAMEEIDEDKLEEEERIETKKQTPKKKPKKWYHHFRWFKSSDDFIVVSGKDAQSNEKLIRKYMKENDLVFHTDITGSPFTVVRNLEDKEIPESTIQEAAEFCGAYSKAWKIGISLVDVYYINPDQVKKEGGLPTGSFMIYGEREWMRRIPVKIAVGNKGEEIISGPPSLVKKVCDKFVEIIPGDNTVKELFEEVKPKVDISLQNLQRIVPYGKGRVVNS